MKVKIKANSIYKRLQIWNGIFDLTNKELEVVSAFIKVNITAKRKNLCSKKNKDDVAKLLQFEDPNDLNNYIKKLKDKGALTFNKGSYAVNKMLNPQIKKIEINIV
tara:strand:- start:6658 stop:6975 length:318 start_codon:yes stop_codon:yes gene_type:complete